jgi:hypothetical protein
VFLHPLLAPAAACWTDALSKINTSKPPATVLIGSVFPEPRVILGAQELATQQKYVFQWIKLRPGFIYRADKIMFSGALICRQVWRDILFGKQAEEFDNAHLSRHGKQKAGAARSAKRYDALKKAMEECTSDDSSVVLSPTLEGSAVWRGTTYPSASALTDNVIKDVLAELAILNFRTELQAVDAAMRGVEPGELEASVAQALFLADTGALLSVSFDPFPGQHSSPEVQTRGPFIVELRNLMLLWGRGLVPAAAATQTAGSLAEEGDEAILAFERVVVQQYVQCVFDRLGRTASIPVCL